MDKIDFRPELAGMAKEIVVYDCSGLIARKLVTRKRIFSPGRDFCLAEGIVKITAVQLR